VVRTEARWLGGIAAEEFLAQEEALFREARPVVRAALFRDRSISVGVRTEISPELRRLAASHGLPILRRATGGSGLLHLPGDLVWSLLLPRDDPLAGRDFVRAYGRLGAPLVAALRSSGVPASWTPALALSDLFCLFGAHGEVLTADGRALGGAAQHASARVLLHHGVVGATVDRELLGELFSVERALLRDRLGGTAERDSTVDLETVGRSVLTEWERRPEGPRDAQLR
jgi:lipoate-protein ligase A